METRISPGTLPPGLRRVCYAMAGLSAAAAILAMAALVAGQSVSQVIDLAWRELSPEAQSAVQYSGTKKALLSVIAGATLLGPVLVLISAGWAFAALARGSVFSQRTASRIRIFAFCVFTAVALSFAAPTLLALAMTYDNPAGLRVLTVAVGTPQVTGLLAGLFLIVMSHAMAEGARLAEENGSFV